MKPEKSSHIAQESLIGLAVIALVLGIFQIKGLIPLQ
jgi:hypothetical protein